MLDSSHVLQNNSPHDEMCSPRFRLLSFGCIKLTSRASYPTRALACQIEAWTGSQQNRVRIPAVQCVTAAGSAFFRLNSPFILFTKITFITSLVNGNAEGIANTLPPMSLNVKCNLCFTLVVIEAGIDHHYLGIDVASMLDACRSLLGL